jgi:hypothetical protein
VERQVAHVDAGRVVCTVQILAMRFRSTLQCYQQLRSAARQAAGTAAESMSFGNTPSAHAALHTTHAANAVAYNGMQGVQYMQGTHTAVTL